MTRQSLRCLGAALLALAAAACGDDSPGGTPPPPEYLGSIAVLVPENGLAALVTIEAERYDSAWVVLLDGPDAAPPRSGAAAFAGASEVTVGLTGLMADRAHALEVWLASGGTAGPADTVPVATAPLPAWIPAGIGAIGTDTLPGFVLLSLPDGAVIVDNQGRVRWYHHRPNGVLNSIQAHPDGRMTILDGNNGADHRFHVLDGLGRETGTLQCAAGRTTRFHDLRIEEDGSAWILCDETRVMDLTAEGGVADAEVTATVVQRLSPAGDLLFEWNSFDHFAITDLSLADRQGAAVNFTHGNGIALDADGGLLLSFRSLDEVTKVDTTTGAVAWRLGGLASQFTILGDPKGEFRRQHGLRVAGPGHLQLLDNGTAAPSRLVRYLLDEVARTATFEWEFIDDPATFTLVGGSSQVLPAGRGLVSFGRAGRVVEVDAAGARRWELTDLDGIYVFRAERLPGLPR
jgi:hypothetical protein